MHFQLRYVSPDLDPNRLQKLAVDDTGTWVKIIAILKITTVPFSIKKVVALYFSFVGRYELGEISEDRIRRERAFVAKKVDNVIQVIFLFSLTLLIPNNRIIGKT